MAVAHQITAQEARTQHQAYWPKNAASCGRHSDVSKPVERQHEILALHIDTKDYNRPQSYMGPVKPLHRQMPVTYAQASKSYHYQRPSLTDRPSLGPVRHRKFRYQLQEKRWSGTGVTQASRALHNTGSNNNAAKPFEHLALTEAAAKLCVYFTSKGMNRAVCRNLLGAMLKISQASASTVQPAQRHMTFYRRRYVLQC